MDDKEIEQFQDLVAINQELGWLRELVVAKSRQKYASFRQSKLNRLLEGSFGDQIFFILCVHPGEEQREETSKTISIGTR